MSQFLHESLLRDIAKLKGKTITLAGCGALGSWTAEYLARAGADNFRLIDKDRVEAHNLGSQFHYKHQLGATKVNSLGQHLYRFHRARVEPHPIELNTSNALSLLLGSDVIICTFDNHKSRQILKDVCLEGQLPCVFGGMNGEHWYGHVEWAENYDNPPDPAHYAIDPCAYPLAISLVTITSAYLYEAAVRYFIFDEKKGARIPLLEPMK